VSRSPGGTFNSISGGSISGTVYQSDGTTPLTGKSIQIEAVVGSSCGSFVTIGAAKTDPTSGNYSDTRPALADLCRGVEKPGPVRLCG